MSKETNWHYATEQDVIKCLRAEFGATDEQIEQVFDLDDDNDETPHVVSGPPSSPSGE